MYRISSDGSAKAGDRCIRGGDEGNAQVISCVHRVTRETLQIDGRVA